MPTSPAHSPSTTEAAINPAPRMTQLEVAAAQVRLLYANNWVALASSLLIGVACLVLMSRHVPPYLTMTWAALLLTTLAGRTLLALGYQRRLPGLDEQPAWGQRFLVGAIAGGMTWGIAGVLLELYGSHEIHGFAGFILGGVTAGAISSNGARLSAYLGFMLPTLLPFMLMLFRYGDLEHSLMAMMTILFMVVLVVTALRHHRVVSDAIALRFVNTRTLHRLKYANRQLHDITSQLAEGLFVVDSQGRMVFMNPEAERLFGWRRTELDGHDLHDLIQPQPDGQPRDESQCGVLRALRQGVVTRRDDVQFRHKDGSCFPVAYTAAPMQLPDDRSAAVVAFQDISRRRTLEQRLAQLATHDDLTGLYNRRELERLLDEELERANRYQHPLSLFMLDVDLFKQVNDSYGHAVGDEVLRQLAQRINQAIRSADIATRYGGEEFVMILPETPLAEARQVAERLRALVADTPFALQDGRQLDIRVSIGVAGLPQDGSERSALLKSADTALYRAKQSGRNRVCLASPLQEPADT